MAFLEILESIRQTVQSYLSENNLGMTNFTVEPSKPGFGDITCNVAFLLSKELHKSPQDISKEIVSFCSEKTSEEIKHVIAHPAGHINFEIDYTRFNKFVLLESIKPTYADIDIGNSSKIIV